MRLSYVYVPAALAALCAQGCGDSTPDPNDPAQFNAQYGSQGQYPPGQYGSGQYQPGQYGQTPAPAPAPAPVPGPAPAPAPASGGGDATPIAPAAAAAAQPVLTAMAASDVKGMSPEGSAFAGQFQQGQTLRQPINIQAGKCYSVIAVGLGIQELDVMIQTNQPPLPPVPLAQDNTSGPNATLGGGGNCFKNPLPVGGPAEVIIKATSGQGIAIAQVYVK